MLDTGTITTQTFGYPAGSNLIADEDTGGVITRTFTHDAAGNMTKDVRGSTTYDYVINHAGRISEIKIDTVSSATYEYNAQNQLVLRSTSVLGGPAGDMHYIYDRQGHLIAEADAATGDTVREYIWLGDMPIAVVADVNTVSPIIYYVHVDHLNRPVMMTDGLKANVWEAVWLPYGTTHSITGAASLDARFPGQWFHIEAGLHYNWHRHYDSTLARYTQPDPLGFVDGPSMFAYALNSPQVYIDSEGRFGILATIAAGAVLGFAADSLYQYLTNGCIDFGLAGLRGGFAGATSAGILFRFVPRLLRLFGPSRGLLGNPMFRNALQPFGRGRFTNAGRALTKHPNVVGVRDAAALTRTFGNQSGINKAASEALKNIMRTGTRSTKNTKAFGKVVDFKFSNGVGARFSAKTNKFIGFLGQ